jgi:hypothetical protein
VSSGQGGPGRFDNHNLLKAPAVHRLLTVDAIGPIVEGAIFRIIERNIFQPWGTRS